jgi:hypothetical protein
VNPELRAVQLHPLVPGEAERAAHGAQGDVPLEREGRLARAAQHADHVMVGAPADDEEHVARRRLVGVGQGHLRLHDGSAGERDLR